MYQGGKIKKILLVILVIVLLGAAVSVVYYFITKDKTPYTKEPGVPIRVEVLNGCGTPGLARRAQIWLRSHGYDVVSIGDAAGVFPSSIIIERRSPDESNAYALARTLRMPRRSVTLAMDTLSPVWVTLILGQDYNKYIPDSLEQSR